MTMERSYKRIASGMIAGFCVLNTQSIAKYSINYQWGGGSLLYSYATEGNDGMVLKKSNGKTQGEGMKEEDNESLPKKELNKAILYFKIECSDSVSDIELEKLLKLSGVTTNGSTVPEVEDLRKADGTTEENKININGTEKFFKEDATDKSDLIRFKLQCKYEDQQIKDAIHPVVDAINSIGDITKENNDTKIKEKLIALLNIAIVAGDDCYNINKNDNVKKWLNEAMENNGKNNYEKDISKLGIRLNRAFMACAESIKLLAPEGIDFTVDNSDNSSDYSKLESASQAKQSYWTSNGQGNNIMKNIYADMKGMLDIFNRGANGYEVPLRLDDNAINYDTEGSFQNSNTFQVYNTNDRKSKLYLKNDATNHKKILTFEVPLDLPEFTDTGKKIIWFKAFIDKKHTILEMVD